MPPYTPNKSKAQQRLMFALAKRGEISQADAEGKAKASDYADLPEHVKHGKSTRSLFKHRLTQQLKS